MTLGSKVAPTNYLYRKILQKYLLGKSNYRDIILTNKRVSITFKEMRNMTKKGTHPENSTYFSESNIFSKSALFRISICTNEIIEGEIVIDIKASKSNRCL